MTEWVWVPVLVLVCMAWRSFPRWLVRRGALSLLFHDTWFHLLYAEEIAANGHRVPRRIGGFLLSTHVAYPPAMHWLLSFFPRRWRERVEPLLGGLWDGLAAAALCGVAVGGIPGGTGGRGALAVLLFLVTPAMLGAGWGPRALHGTPRVFGQMLFSLSAFGFLMYQTTGAWGWLAAAAGVGSLIFVSSLFSVQAFVFLNLLVALGLRSWVPVGLVLASLAMSLVWFKGYSLHLLRSQIRILAAMERSLRRGQFDDVDIQRRNRWQEMFRWPLYVLTDPRKARQQAKKQNTWLILLLQTPLVAGCFLLGGPTGGFATGPLSVAGLYVWAGLAVFVLTSLRPLLFLGEAERYVEHVVPLLCLTMAFSVASAPGGAGIWIPALLLAYSLGAYLVLAVGFVRKGRRSMPRQAQVAAALDWIRVQAAGGRFAVLPRSQMNLLIPYLAGGAVLYGQWASHSPPEVQALRNPASTEFAACREGLFARYRVDHVVVATRARTEPGIRELFSVYPVAFQNEEVTVLTCRRDNLPVPGAGQRPPAG